jgi:hypothetical protein
MRRIDAIGIALSVFVGGGVLYLILLFAGLDSIQAGIWSQAFLVLGLLGWLGSYLFRVGNQNMTYNQQIQNYKDAVLDKQLAEMTPEELAQLQEKLEKDP